MTDLTTLRDLVIPQYQTSERFLQFVDGVLGIMQRRFIEPLDILDGALDLDNVEGILLDYIGDRLGFNRPVVTAAGEFFGFDTGQTDNNYGWNQRPFYTSIEALQTKTPVTDKIYRTILKARGRYIRSAPNFDDVEPILDILYGEGDWSITEEASEPAFTIMYGRSAGSIIINIVEANKHLLIPRSAGVSCLLMSILEISEIMDMINVVGDEIYIILTMAVGGTTPITYSITGLPTGLSFDVVTREISGTIAGSTMIYTVDYTATDANNMTISTQFSWDVVVTLILYLPNVANRTEYFDSSVDIILPEAINGDPPFIYSITGLPGGLIFDPSTRNITGTPDMVDVSRVTYSVVDVNNASADTIFIFQINAVIPGSPQSLVALANGKYKIDLTIGAPSFTGGVSITGYRIDVSIDNSTFTTLVTSNTGLTYSHTGLDQSTQRYYRVYAINSAGTSTGYAEANATTVANQPTGGKSRC